MNEIYGSGRHDGGGDDYRPPDRGYAGFGSSWGGFSRPDYNIYDDDSDSDAYDNSGTDDDGDVDAILHENDHLPEPRTRQEAASSDRDGSTGLGAQEERGY